MGIRADVATALQDALEDARVVGYADSVPPEPATPVVMVGLRAVAPNTVASTDYRTATLDIVCAVAVQTPGLADDALEDLLGAVLDVLDEVPWGNWTGAERGIYINDTYPAYVITIEISGEVAA